MSNEFRVWTTAELLEELKASEARIVEHKERIAGLMQSHAYWQDRAKGAETQASIWQDAALSAAYRLKEWRAASFVNLAVAVVLAGALVAVMWSK